MNILFPAVFVVRGKDEWCVVVVVVVGRLVVLCVTAGISYGLERNVVFINNRRLQTPLSPLIIQPTQPISGENNKNKKKRLPFAELVIGVKLVVPRWPASPW